MFCCSRSNIGPTIYSRYKVKYSTVKVNIDVDLHKLYFFRDLESQNLIDSTSNLAQTKVYIVHGEFDTIVNPVHAWKVKQFYEGFGLDSSKVQSFIKHFYTI